MSDLVLRNARLWGIPEPTDMTIRDGRILQHGRSQVGADASEYDLQGALVLPGLVDAHAHVDKTLFSGPWVPRTAGPGLAAAIEYGRVERGKYGVPHPDYIEALLTNMVVHGTTHARSHIDIDPDLGINAVHAVREAVDRLRGRIDVELVAFPQTGLLTSPGTLDYMREAVEAGVELVGGIDPGGFDGDAVGHLDHIFELAERYGIGLDIHLHDGDNLGVYEFDLIIERTKALSMQGKVTVSHAFALFDADPATRQRLIDDLAENRINVTSVAPRKVLPLRDLDAAGVAMGIGNDGVRDLWSPYGTGEMLERTLWFARNSGFSKDPDIELALEAATYGGAHILGLPDYGLAEGSRADLLVVQARNAPEAVMTHPQPDLVVKNGVVTAHTGSLSE
ncbi:amidohydrolase [Haloglycomyces albus]|uniref:amidohydrolase n=1 Tax=Haloglycomyces albus TaxID=526067 RepID=UPI00046C98EE|nr:amidohydrolase [Haloglycomyces albus]